MATPTVTETELAVFVERAGFTLTPAELAEYLPAYGYVQAMAARIRPAGRTYMAEPAHIYGFAEETSL
jgi:hypothetical protein